MTAETLANMLQGRRSGEGKWQARCPAHEDRLPSLSIREGEHGQVLLHCFAGCTLKAILSVLSVPYRDLFTGKPPSPEQIAASRKARKARERAARIARRLRLAAFDHETKMQALVYALGAKLARAQDNEALADLFHLACNRLHDAEIAADKHYPARRFSAEVEEPEC
jgi:hypothetical protein